MSYDRLVLSPGVDFMFDQIGGLASAEAQGRILHAWKAGPQTIALRKQLESMKDGGVFAISIPRAPYRCPPGPYERACLVADYFKKAKPKSKVVILDANEDVQSKKPLFTKAWADLYRDTIEYRNNSEVKDVDVKTNTALLEFDKFKADVLNVIPPQRAGDIASKSGFKLINKCWVDIDWLSMEVNGTPDVHVIGDAVFPAPTMPSSSATASRSCASSSSSWLRFWSLSSSVEATGFAVCPPAPELAVPGENDLSPHAARPRVDRHASAAMAMIGKKRDMSPLCGRGVRRASGGSRMTSDRSGLALLGLEARVRLVDHVGATLAANDLAVAVAALERLERGTDFHGRAAGLSSVIYGSAACNGAPERCQPRAGSWRERPYPARLRT